MRFALPVVALGAIIMVLSLAILPQRQPPETAWPRMLPADRNAPVTYVALGDSSVVGIGASSPSRSYVGQLHTRLRAMYPGVQMNNLGVGGATAADVRRDQVTQAVRLAPHLVTLSVGRHDVTEGRTVAEFEQDVGAILETLERDTRAVVVANLLPDLALAPLFSDAERAEIGQRTVAFNAALERQARLRGIAVVDLYSQSQAEVPSHPEFVSEDRYHPSDAGYARWAELVWTAIAPRLPLAG